MALHHTGIYSLRHAMARCIGSVFVSRLLFALVSDTADRVTRTCNIVLPVGRIGVSPLLFDQLPEAVSAPLMDKVCRKSGSLVNNFQRHKRNKYTFPLQIRHLNFRLNALHDPFQR